MVGSTHKTEPTLAVKFLSAGMAGCVGDIMTFPLDVAKVRLQVQGEGATPAPTRQVSQLGGKPTVLTEAAKFKYRGMMGTMMTICREEGPRALYNGIVPGLQRQVAFCCIRIGLYDSVKGFYIDAFNKGNSQKMGAGQDVMLRILAGITTGAMAVTCAQPTDVVKVRMQAQAGAPVYTSSFNAYKTIATTEGVKGLWRGVLPNIARNAIVSAAELVSYDLIKENIIKYKILSDNLPCHFVSGFGAGFVATCLASPVDVVKTRFMNSTPGVYSGAMSCAVKMYKEGGPTAFYKGFIPSFLRIASWNIVMFVCFEQFKRGFMELSYFKPEVPSLSDVHCLPEVHCQTAEH